MDKEQARFILQSFRPDGADAQDPDFAEALAVAAEDRDLGDWLATERAQDAAFAAALDHVEIPESLRESILQVLQGDLSEEGDYSDLDATFVGALAALRPPQGLRDQIVTAMKVERTVTSMPGQAAREASTRAASWWRSAAVAAAIVLGAFVAFELTSTEKQPEVVDNTGRASDMQVGTLTLSSLEREFIGKVAAGPSLDFEEHDLGKINAYLEREHGPSASRAALPRGLEGLEGKGCQLLKLGATNASLLCFDKDGQTVHLVVVRREDLAKSEKLAGVDGMTSAGGRCRQCPNTKVSVATWGDDKNAFFLLSKTDPDELRKIF